VKYNAQVGVSDNPLNGFGVVTLASVIPAIVGQATVTRSF
jgi:hypothetical protein